MQTLHKVLLAAGLTLAGTAAWAENNVSSVHEMTVQLPSGAVERIQYAGNVPPKVIIGSAPFEAFWSPPIGFGIDSSFARLERISAEMNRRMEQLFRQASTQWPDQQTINASTLRGLPPGTTGYSWTVTSTGNGYCTHMVQITSPANGGKAQVVSNTSGNCNGKPDKAQRTFGPSLRNDDVTPVKLKSSPASLAETSL
jgi:hypothetical protein